MKPLALVALLAAGGAAAWTLRPTPRPATQEPLVATPADATVDGSRPGQTGRVAYTLSNRSDRPVRVTRIKCCCGAMSQTDINTLLVPAGESRELVVQFSVPETGAQLERVEVEHDGSRAVLLLTATLTGRKPTPYLRDSPRQVAFFDLLSESASQPLTVRTVEPAGSPPWLGAAACDLPGATVERTGFAESLAGPVVQRTYEFRVGWSAFPPGREFFGKVTCAAADSSRVAVGAVAGTRPPDPPFTPAVARLDGKVGSSDAVIFPRKWSPDPWALAAGWSPPDWLKCEWSNEADRQVLRITSTAARPGPARAEVRVATGRRTAAVPVELTGR
jgi:hypothetical protein